MEIRKDKLFLDSFPDDVLYEAFDPRDVFQYMLVCLPYLALDEDGRQQALPNGQRLGGPGGRGRMRDSVLFVFWRGVPRAVLLALVAFSSERAVWVEVVDYAEMHALPLALISDNNLSVEDKPRNGELDRQGHEHGRRVVDEQGGCEGYAEVGLPVDV